MSAGSPAATRAAWLAVMPLAFVALWSTGFIVAKAAAPHAPPITFLLYRFAGVVVLLLPVVWLMRAPWPATARAWWLAVGERVTRVQWLGLLLGIAGIALVLSDRLTLSGVGPLALAVNVLALVGITAGTLVQKRVGANVDLRTGSVIQFAASFIVLLPFALAFESMQVSYTFEFWAALAWSIVALSLVAISLLLVMIRRGRATEVASLMYLTPVVTALLAWLIFDERLGVLAWIGVVVTMAGVALVLKRWRA